MLKYLISLEPVRYVVNGLAATAIHYSVLRNLMDIQQFSSAGAANFIAAVFGIVASFVGSRYFVFRAQSKPLLPQASRFAALYALIASLHGGLLFLWTDLWGLNYTLGFAIALAIQVTASYSGNKRLVFAS